MTRPTCRPGTAWSGYWAGPTSSTSRTPSCAPGPRWATSTAVVAGSSPSCPGPALRTARSASTCKTHTPVWTEAARRSGARQGDPDQVYSTTPAPLPSVEGYRIVWVHSTAKASRDAHARAAGINSGVAALEALDAKLAGPRCRFKTRIAVEQAATIALTDTGADRWVTATVTQTTTKTYKQARAGRPGPQTSYREVSTTRFTVTHDIKLDQIRSDAASDGCFPLISNDRLLSDAQVLAAYRYQPNLERRHHLLKSVQDAAPVLLHNPARIEALFCCQFLALLIAALIERGPHRHATGRPHQDQALPRVPELHRPVDRTDPGDLQHRQPPPASPRRRPREDLPPRTHGPTGAGPRRAHGAHAQGQHATHVITEISRARCAERQAGGGVRSSTARHPRIAARPLPGPAGTCHGIGRGERGRRCLGRLPT